MRRLATIIGCHQRGLPAAFAYRPRRMKMAIGTVVFVHGTGVRLKGYKQSVAGAKELAATAGIKAGFVECAWGDPLGVEFEGLSLPDPPSEDELRREEEDFARWSF